MLGQYPLSNGALAIPLAARPLVFCLAIVNEQYLSTTESNRCLNLGEEVRFRLLCSKHRRIEDAIDLLSQTQVAHQIGGSCVLLVGCQIHPDSGGANCGKFLE